MLDITGYCSLGNADPEGELTVICKTPEGYAKHFLGLSDNVTYVVEQVLPSKVSGDSYRLIIRPEALIVDFDQE